MQGTTRSVEAVEDVATAKAMASGGTVAISASAGGRSCVVVSNGVGGRYKRKGLPGGHSTTSTLMVKKKLCSSAKEIAKPVEAAAEAALRSSGGGGLVAKKKKERIPDEMVGDPSLEDAARALTEFSFLAHKPVRSSPPPKSMELGGRQSPPAALPQWTVKRLRSGRIKRPESSSNENTPKAIATESSNPSSSLLQKQQISECSSSPCGDSQSVITLVKVEDDLLCSSREVEEEEQVEQHKVEVVVVVRQEQKQEEKKNRCPSESEKLMKLNSVSSVDSLLPDSRAESPTSPLSTVLQKSGPASACVVPKFEGSPAARSAFQRVVPIRPVKKQAPCRKLKVEHRTFEDLNVEQASIKHVSRKKPRPTGFVPKPQNQEPPPPQQQQQQQQQKQQQQQEEQQQQQQQQHQQQLAPVKIEEADAFCILALGPPRLSAAEQAEAKIVDVTSNIAPAAALVEGKAVKLDPVVIKLETKPHGKLGLRAASKPKLALSESEKEARKQRRVQANRESARLTIRKKQVLCEELSRKSQFLSTENESFRKEVERLRLKKQSMIEANAKLQERVAKNAGKLEQGAASPAPVSTEKPPDGLVQYQFPPPQFGGLPLPQYWAYAVMAHVQAQAAQAEVQSSEINMGSQYTNAIFAAAAAACQNNPQAGFWNMASTSQGQSSMLPSFYPGPMPGASVASALPTSCGTPATISPITRTLSLPVAQAGTSFSLVPSERSRPSEKPVASYRSGDFADSVHLSSDLKRSAVKQDSAHQGSGFCGRTHYFQMTPGSQTGMAATGVGSMVPLKSGEGNCGLPMSNAPGHLLSRSRSLSTMPKVHSRFSMFGPGGMQEQPTARELEAQRAAAAATEARRKRIELKRTKSNLSRQLARAAEAPTQ